VAQPGMNRHGPTFYPSLALEHSRVSAVNAAKNKSRRPLGGDSVGRGHQVDTGDTYMGGAGSA